MKIYVASSWRNLLQQGCVQTLRAAGFEVYDFKNPREGDHGFSWKQVSEKPAAEWKNQDYLKALQHPVAEAGFNSDFDAMKWADCGVLVLPCNRSAHLEAGWFVGIGKPLHILLAEDNEPELMYKMATSINTSMFELLGSLGVKDAVAHNNN